MACKTEKTLAVKIVGHVVNEKDIDKPEFAGLGVGTPILVAFTRSGNQIRAARLDQFELRIVQDGENIKNQKPGSVIVVMENGEYATVDEINAGVSESLKNDFMNPDKIMKLDNEALDSVVGGKFKIKFSLKNLIRFVGASVVAIATGGTGAIVSIATDIGIAAGTSTVEGFTGVAKKDYSESRAHKTVQPFIDLLPFDIEW